MSTATALTTKTALSLISLFQTSKRLNYTVNTCQELFKSDILKTNL